MVIFRVMARRALSATRAADLLNFLATHPAERFNYSELSRRLGVNLASMHSLLVALVECAYLSFRPADKTYGLGPALIAIGDIALRSDPYAEAARAEMAAFSARTGLESLGFVRAGGDALCVLRAGPQTAPGREVQVGQRLPLIAPLATALVAWASAEECESWLERGGAPRKVRDEQTRMLDAVRARGYAVALEVEERRRIGDLLLELRDDPHSTILHADLRELISGLSRREYQLTTERRAYYDVSNVTAPVLNTARAFELAISAQGFPPGMSIDEISHVGEELTETCRAVSRRAEGLLGPA
jgi:DNA-binding IclR family transcriptional regulator